MHVLRLPSLAENIVEATLLRWHVAPGARVAVGDRLAELVSEKAAFDYTATQDGLLSHLLAPPNSVLPIGYALALLDADDALADKLRDENRLLLDRHAELLAGGLAPATAAPTDTPSGSTPINPTASTSSTASAAPAAFGAAPFGGSVRATPAARRLAKERGVDLADLARRFPGVLLKEDHVRSVGGDSSQSC